MPRCPESTGSTVNTTKSHMQCKRRQSGVERLSVTQYKGERAYVEKTKFDFM